MATHKRNLIEYFKKNISKGYKADSLKWVLINQGYTRTDVETAIHEAEMEMKVKKDEDDKPKIKYEVYDENNRPIQVELRKPFSLRNFLKKLFS